MALSSQRTSTSVRGRFADRISAARAADRLHAEVGLQTRVVTIVENGRFGAGPRLFLTAGRRALAPGVVAGALTGMAAQVLIGGITFQEVLALTLFAVACVFALLVVVAVREGRGQSPRFIVIARGTSAGVRAQAVTMLRLEGAIETMIDPGPTGPAVA